MYTEIVKIIEGALLNDKEKVINYAGVLADNLEKQNENQLANKIRFTLNNKSGKVATLDSLYSKPVDTESRMDIVDVISPQIKSEQVILNAYSRMVIQNFIDSYNCRDEFLKSGIDFKNSLLLYGPPGCGKTTVAHYIASMTKLPLVIAKLDGMVSSLLGSTSKNIRKIFDFASRQECILFLDEFDVIAKLRDDKNELGELKRVVNSLIQNIDSFNNNSILIAATNHHELLDPAIWRRFTTIVSLEKPNKEDVKRMLKLLLEKKENDFSSVPKKMDSIVTAFIGFSHSEIKTIVFNSIRDNILSGHKCLCSCDILKEIYFYRNHSIENEELFISYLLANGATHKDINKSLGIPLRKIQAVSKNVYNQEVLV